MTDNHEYNTPPRGTKEWHVPINDNFEQMDTDIEIRDAESERGKYHPKDGAKFFAADTGTVYLGDGSAWNPVRTMGPNPQFETINASRAFFPGQAHRIVVYRGSDEKFHADSGNDAVATNSNPTPVVQAAMDSIREMKGGTVHITEDLDGLSSIDASGITGTVRLFGKGETTLSFDGVETGIDCRNTRRIIARDIVLNGAGDGKLIAGGTDNVQSAAGWNFTNVRLRNAEYGLWSDPDTDYGIYDSSFIECDFRNCSSAGIRLDNSMNGLFRSTFRMNSTAMELAGPTAMHVGLYQTVFSGNDYDIDLYDDGIGGTFYNCWFERQGEYSEGLGNGETFRKLDGGGFTRQLVFSDCYFSETESFTLRNIWTPELIVLRDCWFNHWDNWTTNFPSIGRVTTQRLWRFDTDAKIHQYSTAEYGPMDVRTIQAPTEGHIAYHDGSGPNPEGPVFYNGMDWISLVDNTKIE